MYTSRSATAFFIFFLSSILPSIHPSPSPRITSRRPRGSGGLAPAPPRTVGRAATAGAVEVVRRGEHVSASHRPATRRLLRGHAKGTLGGARLGRATRGRRREGRRAAPANARELVAAATGLVVGAMTLEVEVDGAAELQALLAADVELLNQVVHLLLGDVELALALHHLILGQADGVGGGVRLGLPPHHLVTHGVGALLEFLPETVNLRRESAHLGVVLRLELEPGDGFLLADRLLGSGQGVGGARSLLARLLDLLLDLGLLRLEVTLLGGERSLERCVALLLVGQILEIRQRLLLELLLIREPVVRLLEQLLDAELFSLGLLELTLEARHDPLDLLRHLRLRVELLLRRFQAVLKLGDATRGVLLHLGRRAEIVNLAPRGARLAGTLADGLERLGVRAVGGRGFGHGSLRGRGRRRLLRLRHRLAGIRLIGVVGVGVGVGVDRLGDGLAGGLGLGHRLLALGSVGGGLVGRRVDGLGDGDGRLFGGNLGFGHGLLARDLLLGFRHDGVGGAALVSVQNWDVQLSWGRERAVSLTSRSGLVTAPA
mmetsp:Transcript_10901/g.43930  ORF Transcript_10901/g.43930 Transcript_10901/m.43930 type:complete len:546 (+) Transcript_10901:114-1751(+)